MERFAPIALRLFLGVFLVYMSHDNVLSSARMAEFAGYLEHHGFPLPSLSAHVSVYAQFACGILVLLGLATRIAALVMVVNFLVAIIGVHTGDDSFRTWLEPCAMLAVSAALALGGPGPYSLDAMIAARRAASASAARRS